MSRQDDPFFVGYLPAPVHTRRFLLGTSLATIAGFAAGGALVGSTQDDPGPGAFRFDFGRQTVTGVLEVMPYPVLRVTEGNERIQAGQALMLSSGGKRGVAARAQPLAGQLVTVSGILLTRGDLLMLQLRNGKNGLAAAKGDVGGEGEVAPQSTTDLGRWRMAGEICDGKCLAGAMRPGRGLSHKACANLCLIGGVPPVFVSTQPVEGSEYFLLGGPDGAALPDTVYSRVGQFITAEGTLQRRGDLLVWLIDPQTITVTS